MIPRNKAGLAGSTVEIVGGFDEAAPLWRAFESQAVMTPYGRYDWIAACRHNLSREASDLRVAVLRGVGGDPLFLLPFQTKRRGGFTIATSVGGTHANYNLPLLRPDFAAGLTAEAARALLAETGRAVRADLLLMHRVPVTWNGWRNPFAAGGQPCASRAWALRLESDGEATLARSMSAEARKKIRKKARGLAKAGPVRVLRAQTPEEAELLLAAFHRQKAHRLGERGIPDPYADPGARAFLREAATEHLGEGWPALEFHGLLVGDEVIAVLGGAVDGRRFSGMVVSFQAGEFEKFSPGELLICEVIGDLCRRGFEVFDLGAGDARYKRSICDEAEALVDVMIPLTLPGRSAALVANALLDAKRRIKGDPRAMAVVTKLRKLRAGLRS
ncbi:GNAT family N-acetyltransferase [Enterovirga sp.]|uniref:GNAT family N-acetyltransferase n=1 Tax=Enterovirga sp. TaxID=2026350 RepID=UPI002BE5F1A6|nr:GNAT family N-acetyltransferase [Enterovirga sp.]HMO28702.1 GNAT family N-acetyltransferase [Enterovirga sp.]